jgi:hypothetical protein
MQRVSAEGKGRQTTVGETFGSQNRDWQLLEDSWIGTSDSNRAGLHLQWSKVNSREGDLGSLSPYKLESSGGPLSPPLMEMKNVLRRHYRKVPMRSLQEAFE